MKEKLKPLVVALAFVSALNAQALRAEAENNANTQGGVTPEAQVPARESNTEVPAQLDTMVIKAVVSKPAVPANLPATVEGVTATQIDESINAVTTGAVLQYLPSVHVRERYIGDVNGILVMRVNSSIASAQTTVYADGMLLSNFLNNSYATPPRWGMVSPEEIDRVDVIYGPFSALYPGNSAGGIVNITTHMPDKFEGHASLDAFQQHYQQFGTDGNFNGTHGTASVGDKVGDWSFFVNADHLDNTGQPMTFGNKAVASTGGAGGLGAVTGAVTYLNPANVPTLVTSAIGIDHSVQDNGKIKVAYDFSPTLRATYTFGIWQNNADKTVDSYLKNALGQTIYAGAVQINGVNYNVSAPSAGTQVSDYTMHGLKLKSDTGGMFDWEADVSLFNENKDEVRASSGNTGTTPSSAATAGTIAVGDGTGWKNLDLRGDFRPDGDMKSTHQLSFGYHADSYVLQSVTYNLISGINWKVSAPGALSKNSMGKTQTQALYLQDAWQMAPTLKLVAGGRMENWQATNGSNFASGANVTYQDRSVSAFSPKLALFYQASESWELRSSYGRGTRFPTVGELFSNVGITNVGTGAAATPAQIATFPAPYNSAKTNNPNLMPEAINSLELTAERLFENGLWRNSLFGEDKRNAIISQTDVTTLPGYSINGNQNVDKVRTVGFESALELNNLWQRGFDFSGSATWVNSIIAADAQNPGLVGTDQPRIPNFRATLSGTYHASEQISFSLNYRYSGRQHVALYNTTTHSYTDPNPNVYGTTVSNYSVLDAKALYKVNKQWSASFGVNNITNCRYFVNPNPYPMRTVFASLKLDM